MKSNQSYRQFDIVQVDMGLTKGSEQQGDRPCLIVESNALVPTSRTVMIAPFTTQKLIKIYPYEVIVEPNKENGLRQTSKLKLNQIKVIDKIRIKKHLGFLEPERQTRVLHAIALAFDLARYFAR